MQWIWFLPEAYKELLVGLGIMLSLINAFAESICISIEHVNF